MNFPSQNARVRPGLVSITFRKLSPAEIVDLCVRAKLQGIEWGGDVHVPHGDLERARFVKRLTEDAGLSVAAYGSYYRAQGEIAFETVLESALELGAPLIRVWAGTVAAPDADDTQFASVAAELKRAAQLAHDAGIVVAAEWHGGTLTQTPDGAARLLREVDHPNLRLLWQPDLKATLTGSETGSVAANLNGLRGALPTLENVHVFHWTIEGKRPLDEGEHAWSAYWPLISKEPRERWALLEFVKDDAPEQLLRDAQTLNRWLQTPVSGALTDA